MSLGLGWRVCYIGCRLMPACSRPGSGRAWPASRALAGVVVQDICLGGVAGERRACHFGSHVEGKAFPCCHVDITRLCWRRLLLRALSVFATAASRTVRARLPMAACGCCSPCMVACISDMYSIYSVQTHSRTCYTRTPLHKDATTDRRGKAGVQAVAAA